MLSSFMPRRRAIAAQADAFVQSIAPAAPPARRAGQPLPQAAERRIARAAAETARFVREQRVGFIGRCLLANKVKWRLREAGHPEPFVDACTERLVLSLYPSAR